MCTHDRVPRHGVRAPKTAYLHRILKLHLVGHLQLHAKQPRLLAALLQVHAQVIQRITAGIEAYGLKCQGVTESPLKGDKSGNTEFLAHFTHDPSTGPISTPPDGLRDEGGDSGRAPQLDAE